MSKEDREQIEQHLRWLTSEPARLKNGLCAAWVDGSTPSHAYQESTGYLVSLFCYLFLQTGEERFYHHAVNTSRFLATSIGDSAGCGRDGVVYLFDTSVCLRGLAALFETFPDTTNGPEYQPLRHLRNRLAETSARLVADKAALQAPASTSAKSRWSETFNVHLVKSIHHACQWLRDDLTMDRIQDLIDRRYHNGLFYLDDAQQTAYLHAHCYALEGLLALQKPTFAPLLEESAARLAQLQTTEGGIPRYWPCDSGPELASDSTAQAIRIWQCTNPSRYAENTQRGFDFLRTMTSPGGGVRYSSRATHLNSWTTIFLVQALLWQGGKGEAGWLI